MGRPSIIVAVADGQGELYVDDVGRLRVVGARDSEGLARLRYEMPLYNQHNQGDAKIDDDAVDGFRGLMVTFGVRADRKTLEERVDDQMPSGWRSSDIRALPPVEAQSRNDARQAELQEIRERMIAARRPKNSDSYIIDEGNVGDII